MIAELAGWPPTSDPETMEIATVAYLPLDRTSLYLPLAESESDTAPSSTTAVE
jgi:hypothetical protein